MATPVVIPDIGDFTDVEVIEILVSCGDVVIQEDSLITLESNKATMEVPAPIGGTISEIKVAIGDRISKGDIILFIKANNEIKEKFKSKEKKHKRTSLLVSNSGHYTYASPSIRRFAHKLNININNINGTGRKGRITYDDLAKYIKQTKKLDQKVINSKLIPEVPEIDFSRFGPVEKVELNRIKKISGKHLHQAWLNIPHITQFDEVDVTEMENFRKENKEKLVEKGYRLTIMPFLIYACAKTLQALPEFNSSLASDMNNLIIKKYIHIGVAVDTPDGLMVPVIHNVNEKGIADLAKELVKISSKARNGKLTSEDIQGGCFTISSLGSMGGGTQFTPIINIPEVAILGISRIIMKPIWNGSNFKPRLVMPFSLSYDHRVIDGVQGVKFTTYLKNLLSDIRLLLL